MVSQGYKDWLSHKPPKPYTLILPAKHLQANLKVYGLTVYDYPDDSHLKADRPQDHTPFSVTGWPSDNARWYARALDIMPRSGSEEGRKENADIMRQIIKDRDAGHPGVAWIKYLNWTDEKGVCRHEAWQDSNNPNRRVTTSSTDKGHGHISGRSDMDDYTGAEAYDPVARMLGINVGGETEMSPDERAVLDQCERVLTAMCTRAGDQQGPGESADRSKIVLIKPWPNGPKEVPNPIDWLQKQIDALKDAQVPAQPASIDYTALAKALLAELTNKES